ncbi:MAG: methionyl-tRNA formyltransferase [Ferruginibacter sp.]|nr:methionyl-tRNA formyltransferase [Ferruginibacter sp.]
MGTPEFAVAALAKLLNAGLNIAGVVTAPDKPGGRGLEMQQSAVKKYSTEQGLRILQPEKLKNPQFLDQLKSLHADLQIVVAFRMLPEIVWNMPPMGTVNLHGSLLPQYRGAAPINWAIINGEKETGVTTFKLQHEIDTGNILLTAVIPIGEEETAGELHDRMKETGAELLLSTVKGLTEGNLVETPQSRPGEDLSFLKRPDGDRQTVLKKAPKIFTETCQIDWNKPVEEVYNLVRGLSPYPAAFTFLEGKKLKVFRVDKVYEEQEADKGNEVYKVNKVPVVAAGEFETDKKTFLYFACMNGYIYIKELQLEGKKKMMVEDFLRGYRWG